MTDGEVTDLRSYGRDDLAINDLATRCNPNTDSRFAGSCKIEHELNVQQIAGQRKSTAKSKAAKKRIADRRAAGLPVGRPPSSGMGIKNAIDRAQVQEKLISEGKMKRDPQRPPREDEIE